MVLDLSEAVTYHYNEFPPVSLNYPIFLEAFGQATDALARYDQMLKTMHNTEIFLAPLRYQEAVISSRMEGTISTMDEILRFDADHGESDAIHSNVRNDVIETVLYRRALVSAQQALTDGYPFSSSLIKGIHQRLLSLGRGASKSPGMFKDEQNYLADQRRRKILFVPISPESLSAGLDTLFQFIENDRQPLLLKTALSHVEFEALHPFKDGNGRIGRMLITLMLWRYGAISAPHFYISGFFEDNKDQYIDLMRRVSEKGEWSEWCLFFMQAIHQQALGNLSVAESIRNLYDEMKALFTQEMPSRWNIAALDFIFTTPVFRNNKFTSNAGIPAPTAAKISRMMVEKGLLETLEESAGRRPALYAFEPLLKLVRV